MLGVFVEVLDPFKAQLVVGPSVITDSDFPSCWDASLVPGCLTKLAVEDDKWRDCPSSCIDCLDYSNPLLVPRLFCP